MASITLTIPDEKYPEFKKNFLHCHPLPSGSEATEDEWVKKWLRDEVVRLHDLWRFRKNSDDGLTNDDSILDQA